MPEGAHVISPPALAAIIRERCATAGLMLTQKDDVLSGERELITARWPLGGRGVRRVVRCSLDERSATVRWHETVIDRSWGLAPPTLTAERSSVKGKTLSGARRDRSVGGGGEVDYAVVREAARAAVEQNGWRFEVAIP